MERKVLNMVCSPMYTIDVKLYERLRVGSINIDPFDLYFTDPSLAKKNFNQLFHVAKDITKGKEQKIPVKDAIFSFERKENDTIEAFLSVEFFTMSTDIVLPETIMLHDKVATVSLGVFRNFDQENDLESFKGFLKSTGEYESSLVDQLGKKDLQNYDTIVRSFNGNSDVFLLQLFDHGRGSGNFNVLSVFQDFAREQYDLLSWQEHTGLDSTNLDIKKVPNFKNPLTGENAIYRIGRPTEGVDSILDAMKVTLQTQNDLIYVLTGNEVSDLNEVRDIFSLIKERSDTVELVGLPNRSLLEDDSLASLFLHSKLFSCNHEELHAITSNGIKEYNELTSLEKKIKKNYLLLSELEAKLSMNGTEGKKIHSTKLITMGEDGAMIHLIEGNLSLKAHIDILDVAKDRLFQDIFRDISALKKFNHSHFGPTVVNSVGCGDAAMSAMTVAEYIIDNSNTKGLLNDANISEDNKRIVCNILDTFTKLALVKIISGLTYHCAFTNISELRHKIGENEFERIFIHRIKKHIASMTLDFSYMLLSEVFHSEKFEGGDLLTLLSKKKYYGFSLVQ